MEDAPNKQVHADDLAEALALLHGRPSKSDMPPTPTSDNGNFEGRNRSGSSTTIYDPSEHGGSPGLPAISVEDFTGEWEVSPIIEEKPIFAHTTRPPVELML